MENFQHENSERRPEITKLLNASYAAAVENFSFVIASEHLLLSVLQDCDPLSADYLRNLGLTKEAVNEEIELLFSQIGVQAAAVSDTLGAKNSFVFAPILCQIVDEVEASAPKSESLGTISLCALQVILKYEDSVAFKVIQNLGIDVAALREWVEREVRVRFTD